MMNTYFSLMNKGNKIIDFIISRDKLSMNVKFKQIGNSKADSRISILNKMLHYQINEAYKVV